MEPDGYCTLCYEPISFEAAIFSDCAEALCESCYQTHECGECFPDEDDSDSTYELSETSGDSDDPMTPETAPCSDEEPEF